MVLRIGEQKWHLHFHIEDEPGDSKALWYVVVKCLVHTGPCILTHAEPRHCINGLHGEARCSRKDNFVRAVGNRLALTRAIETLPISTREALWAAYWQVARRPKETSAHFRLRTGRTQNAA